MPERPHRPFAWALAAVLAVAVAVPAVAQDAPPSRRVATAVPPLLTCGGLPFAPAALDRPRGYERRSGPLARALRRFLRRKASLVGQPRRGWFLLAREGNHAEVAAGRGPYGLMGFVLRRGRWRWEGSGGCRLRTYEDGMSAVHVAARAARAGAACPRPRGSPSSSTRRTARPGATRVAACSRRGSTTGGAP